MQTRSAISDARGLTAASALGIIGALTIFIAPAFLGLVADQGRLGDAGAGYVISSDIDIMAVAIAVATFLITRTSWRQLALVGLGLIAAGSLATAFVHAEGAFFGARVCAGTGEGLAVGVSFAALGQARNPDRAFGAYLCRSGPVARMGRLLSGTLDERRRAGDQSGNRSGGFASPPAGDSASGAHELGMSATSSTRAATE